jgi:hypothetical protein
VPAGLVLDRGDSLAFSGARDDDRRAAARCTRCGVCLVDRVEVVTVDYQRFPAERTGAVSVGLGVPAVHRLAALPEPVHVDDDGQVVESPVGRVFERLPDRSLRHLAVADQHPDPVWAWIDGLRRESDADTDGQAETQRAGGDVDPRDRRARMPLEATAEAPHRQELLVADRPGRRIERIEKG